MPCHKMWCGECYSSAPTIDFFVNCLESEGGRKRKRPAGSSKVAPDAFLRARDGDHAMILFECDACVFHKLHGRSPRYGNPMDALSLGCIRRVNLDAFWRSATATVNGNRDKLQLGIWMSELVGLPGPYTHEGPLPSHDHCDYEVAIQMLLYSKQPGKYSVTHLQFDTIRKLRGSYSNQVRVSPQSPNWESMLLGDAKGDYQCFTRDPCGSFWFYRFMKGLKIAGWARSGDQIKG
jgi:hypothetical protein